MNPLTNQSRRVERGWEYVTIHIDEKHARTMQYLAQDESPDKRHYKSYLCVICGYPEIEWLRVVDMKFAPSAVTGCLDVTVKFANPGKTLESIASKVQDYSECDEEAWAAIKHMNDRLKNGSASLEPETAS